MIKGEPPDGTKITRPADAPYPSNALVTVRTKQQGRLPGLISGRVDYEPGDFCPKHAQMTHEEVNKDHSDEPGREAQHAKAIALAVQQSHHERCHLVAMTQAAWERSGRPTAARVGFRPARGAMHAALREA